MTRELSKPLSFILAAFLLAASACGDDDSTTQDTGPTNGADTGTDTPTEQEGREWVPALFRFEEFNITRPTGIGPILNGLINIELRSGRLNLLLQTADFADERGETTFILRANTGNRDDLGTYDFAESPDDVPSIVRPDGSFENSELTFLAIPVTFYIDPVCSDGPCSACRTNADCPEDGFICGDDPDGQCEKVIEIPLNLLEISGELEVDTGTGEQYVSSLNLNGVVFKEAADNIVFNLGPNLVTLTQVLDPSQMDYPAEPPRLGWWMSAAVYCEEVPWRGAAE